MLKFISAVAVAAALCLQPAAAKLGGAHSVTETAEQSKQQKNFSFTSFVIEHVQITFSMLLDRPHHASEKGDEYKYSYTKRECEAASEENSEEAEGAEAKDQEPAGPEPLYFGF